MQPNPLDNHKDNMPHSPRFEFGPFQLDLNDRLLTRAAVDAGTTLNWRLHVTSFDAACAMVAAGLGVITAWRATSGQVRSALAEAGRRQGTSARSRHLGRVIVAGQVAITLTLLTGAGLLGRSMLRVLSIDPGFETEHIVTLDLKLPDLEPGNEGRRAQFRRVADRARYAAGDARARDRAPGPRG